MRLKVLHARLFGALEIELDGTAIDSPVNQRPWALFAYLAVADRPVSRAELANTFWPDVADRSARASVRSALWALRRRLGEELLVDGDRVSLRAGGWIDLAEFDRLAAAEPDRALALCRGELLDGLEDEWALIARERHRGRVVELLEQGAEEAERCGDAPRAIELTRAQVERDRFDEAAHRRLMQRLADAGDRPGALRLYRALTDRLRRELSVAPSAETRGLADELRTETSAAPFAAPAGRAPGLLPLLGRERELAELQRAWLTAAGGAGCVATLRGEAGIGKTRLATELVADAAAAGARTAWSAALDLGGTAPFSLWAELIRELLPSLPAPPAEAAWPEDLAVLVAELPSHFARSGVATTAVALDLQRTRLFEAVVALLHWAARDRPLLLVLEDAHDADTPSLELAAYAARRLAGLRTMMLITRRALPESPACDRLEHALRSRGLLACELTLDPLGPGATAALARAAARLSSGDVGRVVERAEGSPLLTVETARALARGSRDAPATLRASVRATIAPLAGAVRGLIETAAVAARAIEPTELDRLDFQDAAVDALQTGLLFDRGGRIAFRHALLREAAYDDIAEPRRRGLHRRWAEALIGLDRTGAEAARHLRMAGADADAVPQLVLAAADARAVAAIEEAIGYLSEALELRPDDADIWLELGELESWRSRRGPAEVAFRRAIELLGADDPLRLARANLRWARAYHGPICYPPGVRECASTAARLLAEVDAPALDERSEALAAWAWAEAVSGSVEETDRLLAELEQLVSGSDDLRIYDAGHVRAHALLRRGRLTESYAPFIAAAEAIARAGRPDLTYGCWANVAGAASAAGEPGRALEFLARGLEAIAGQGLQSLEIHFQAARSFVFRGLGRLDEAQTATDIEAALAEELAHPALLAMASHDGGLVALAGGRYGLAAELLGASLVDVAPISRPLTRLALAEALALDGRPDEAAIQLRAMVFEPVAASDFPATLVPRLSRAQGLIARARGQGRAAERHLQEAIEGWERLLDPAVRIDSLSFVLTDLGRPVVGMIEPERELARARADREAIRRELADAVVP